MSNTLNVGSDGMGRWIYGVVDPLLQRTFPHTIITHDDTKDPDLVIRSHFHHLEAARPYTCPYISWSGESHRVIQKHDYDPILEINTAHYPEVENSLYFPHLFAEISKTERPDVTQPKRWCAAYAFSHRVLEREQLFIQMRVKEPTCYAFGPSCFTRDNPFVLKASDRSKNGEAFRPFGFVVAMENKVVPGYMTEKIGNAFCAGAVPIYWGDSATVSEFFNPAAYLDVHDYASPRAAGLAAVEIWRDPQKLQRFLDAPITVNSRVADYEAVRSEYRPWQRPFVDCLRATFPDLR
jgi:hypothetical protein